MNVLTQKSYIVYVHRYGFRAGEPAEILGLKFAKPISVADFNHVEHEWRLAFEVQYFDGVVDYVAYQDVISGNAVIISDVDLANERIPLITK